ncbi:MAG: acyltransferase [Clostridia bacterium]|nr:acyltransferase [Clostridia bacterium]
MEDVGDVENMEDMENIKSEEIEEKDFTLLQLNNYDNGKKYFKRLDLIRIISCVMVLLYHLNILQGGFLAVCTFFVLSGFLSIRLAVSKEKLSIKEYYISKIKKIYIPLLVVVSITVIYAKLNPSINWPNLKQETISVILGYNNNWQLKANLDYFTRHINSPFMHLWYISILMQFDLIFPILYVVIRKMDKKINRNISTIIVTTLTITLTILFYQMSKNQDIMQVYYNTYARSFSIFAGVLMALIHFKYNKKLPTLLELYNKVIFIIYAIALILMCIFVPADPKFYAIYMIIATIISVRLIRYSVVPKRKKEKVGKLDNIVKILAKCSYEVYLVQYPVIFFMQNVLAGNKLKVPIIILVTFIISAILQILIENDSKHKVQRIIKTAIVRCNYCVWL